MTTKALRAEIGAELGIDLAPYKKLVKELALEIMASKDEEPEPESSADFADDDEGEESEDSEESEPAKPSKKAKRRKVRSAATEKKAAKVKKILKLASIRIPPRLYSVHKTEESLEAALLGLLEKENLGLGSTKKEISKVRKRLELARDMDGIDMSNIVSGRRRRG